MVTRQEKEGKGPGQAKDITIRANAPARIKLVLKEVDQFLFQSLSKILGEGYFSTFNGQKYVRIVPEVEPNKKMNYVNEVLPSVEHNPIIVFHLRPNVKFHDGHPLDADDVKFTYEGIMNPKNLSPRLSDYEPIKEVEVVDPLTVRIVYKRLYSPALGTWAMGILPEHLLNDESLRKEAIQSGRIRRNFPCARVASIVIRSDVALSDSRSGNQTSTFSWIVMISIGRDRPITVSIFTVSFPIL